MPKDGSSGIADHLLIQIQRRLNILKADPTFQENSALSEKTKAAILHLSTRVLNHGNIQQQKIFCNLTYRAWNNAPVHTRLFDFLSHLHINFRKNSLYKLKSMHSFLFAKPTRSVTKLEEIYDGTLKPKR